MQNFFDNLFYYLMWPFIWLYEKMGGDGSTQKHAGKRDN